MTYGPVDADEPTAGDADRGTWESKASKQTLADTDELLKLIKEVQPKAALKYNKHYIGLEIDGASRNFVSFVPKKQHVVIRFKLPQQSDDVKSKLAEAGIHILAYDAQFGQFGVRIDSALDDKQRGVVRDLIRQAWELYGKP